MPWAYRPDAVDLPTRFRAPLPRAGVAQGCVGLVGFGAAFPPIPHECHAPAVQTHL